MPARRCPDCTERGDARKAAAVADGGDKEQAQVNSDHRSSQRSALVAPQNTSRDDAAAKDVFDARPIFPAENAQQKLCALPTSCFFYRPMA